LFKTSLLRYFVKNEKVMAKAYLDIILTIQGLDRAGVTAVYNLYKEPFLKTVNGALSDELLIHIDDLRILQGFKSREDAQCYFLSKFCTSDFITSLKPDIIGNPNVKIYEVS